MFNELVIIINIKHLFMYKDRNIFNQKHRNL